MIVVVVEIDRKSQADLFEVGKTGDLLASLLGAGERREQQRR